MAKTFATLLALGTVTLAGCHGCEKDKPYTPFGVASTLGSAGPAPSASDDAPDELLSFVKDLLPRFHEAEVETAQVVDPVAAKRKRR